MKKIIILIMMAVLILTCCTAIKLPGEKGQADFDNIDDAEEESAESIALIHIDKFVDGDLFLEVDLTDGAFYEIPGLSGEERDSFQQDENYRELLQTRLESNGVFLTSSRYDYIFPDIHYASLPVIISHYKSFDFIFVRYPGYRGSDNGNLYIFENSLYKGCMIAVGDVDFSDCFREIGDNIWLTVSLHTGGSGLGVTYKVWHNLNDDQFSVDLFYTDYYATGNFGYGRDIDFSIGIVYDVSDEELYINESDIPTLRISWNRMVSDYDKIINLTCSGYEEYTIVKPGYWELFDSYAPSEGDFIDGFEEQLDTLIYGGTEEESHIARQIINNFAVE